MKPAASIVDRIITYAERLRDRELTDREIVELERVRSTLTGIDLHSEGRRRAMARIMEGWCIANRDEDGRRTS